MSDYSKECRNIANIVYVIIRQEPYLEPACHKACKCNRNYSLQQVTEESKSRAGRSAAAVSIGESRIAAAHGADVLASDELYYDY